MMKCPSCGHTFTTAKPKPKDKATSFVKLPQSELDQMTDTELYAYRKRIANAADIAFIRAKCPELADQLDTLPLTTAGAKRAFDLARLTMDVCPPANEDAFWKEHYRRIAELDRAKFKKGNWPPSSSDLAQFNKEPISDD